jgi:hypothetical protein
MSATTIDATAPIVVMAPMQRTLARRDAMGRLLPCGLARWSTKQKRQAGGQTALLLWTAMKEGLLGGRLSVSPKSESKEARCSCCTLEWI